YRIDPYFYWIALTDRRNCWGCRWVSGDTFKHITNRRGKRRQKWRRQNIRFHQCRGQSELCFFAPKNFDPPLSPIHDPILVNSAPCIEFVFGFAVAFLVLCPRG